MKKEFNGFEIVKWLEARLAEYESGYKVKSGMLSPIAYKSTLFLMFSKKYLSLSEIAEEVGTTYGTLRFWKVDEKYENCFQENINEYASYYVKRIYDLYRHEGFMNLVSEYQFYTLPLQEKIIKILGERRASFSKRSSTQKVGNFMIQIINGLAPIMVFTEAAIHFFKEEGKIRESIAMRILHISSINMFRLILMELLSRAKNIKEIKNYIKKINRFDEDLNRQIIGISADLKKI